MAREVCSVNSSHDWKKFKDISDFPIRFRSYLKNFVYLPLSEVHASQNFTGKYISCRTVGTSNYFRESGELIVQIASKECDETSIQMALKLKGSVLDFCNKLIPPDSILYLKGYNVEMESLNQLHNSKKCPIRISLGTHFSKCDCFLGVIINATNYIPEEIDCKSNLSVTSDVKKTPAANTYEYTLLKDLSPNSYFYVHGVVKSLKPVEITSTKEYYMRIHIVDDSLQISDQDLICQLFYKDISELPLTLKVGDVVRFHRLRIQLYQQKLQGTKGMQFTWTIFGSDPDKMDNSTVVMSKPKFLTECEFIRPRELAMWAKNLLSPTSSMNITLKPVLVSDLDCSQQNFSLHAQIVGIFYFSDAHKAILVVSDGTMLNSNTIKDTYPYSSMLRLKDSSFNFVSWRLLSALMNFLCIILVEENCLHSLSKIYPEQFLQINNLSSTLYSEGILSIQLKSDKPNLCLIECSSMTEPMNRVQSRINSICSTASNFEGVCFHGITYNVSADSGFGKVSDVRLTRDIVAHKIYSLENDHDELFFDEETINELDLPPFLCNSSKSSIFSRLENMETRINLPSSYSLNDLKVSTIEEIYDECYENPNKNQIKTKSSWSQKKTNPLKSHGSSSELIKRNINCHNLLQKDSRFYRVRVRFSSRNPLKFEDSTGYECTTENCEFNNNSAQMNNLKGFVSSLEPVCQYCKRALKATLKFSFVVEDSTGSMMIFLVNHEAFHFFGIAPTNHHNSAADDENCFSFRNPAKVAVSKLYYDYLLSAKTSEKYYDLLLLYASDCYLADKKYPIFRIFSTVLTIPDIFGTNNEAANASNLQSPSIYREDDETYNLDKTDSKDLLSCFACDVRSIL